MTSMNTLKFLKITLAGLIISAPMYSLAPKAFSAAQMSDYCYLPPFVTDMNTPPNLMVVYEKGSDIKKRAYSTTYNASQIYYGFFDSNANYTYNSSSNYFEKSSSCTMNGTSNCFSGNLLNWALMSSVDLTRKALIGFGWPDTGSSTAAGQVYTYSGNFVGPRTAISYGQWEDGNSLAVSATLNVGSNYTYTFCLSKFTGSNPTGLSIRAKSGTSAPACTGSSAGLSINISGGQVAMKFTDEKRTGLIQKYADKDQNMVFDSDGPRFGIRRWQNGADKEADVISDGSLTDAQKEAYFRNTLSAISKAPPDDSSTPSLSDMSREVYKYFHQEASTYQDNDSYSQTPYNWATDPARECRKTFALYLTTGVALGTTESIVADGSLPAACCTSSASCPDVSQFSKNACYSYQTDLYTSDTKKQNISTYIVHTTFYGTGAGNAGKLKYAASSDVSGGEYFQVNDPASFETSLEQAILNILATSASASTVATLTSQTRESATLTQAYFYPRKGNSILKWVGYLRLLWSDPGANLREDTLNTAWLDLKKDSILSFFYDSADNQYKARTYAVLDASPYQTINSCNPTAAGNGTKTNDQVLPIWNAQDKLETKLPDNRTIKIGIGDASGVVTSSTCSSNSGFCDFTTSLDATLQPFWNSGSFCSNNPNRWCAVNSDCNYCVAHSSRGCPNGTNAECNYCSLNTALACTGSADCLFDFGTCQTTTKYCTNNSTQTCSTDAGCGGTCTSNVCSNTGAFCTSSTDCSGSCKGTCSGNAGRFCLADADCSDNFGTCTTGDTCSTGYICNAECNSDCARSIIKYVRGYDKPDPSGGQFRLRHQCSANADCSSGTCGSDKVCTGTDLTKTLKLGDIVYSTPRISPNNLVNGYTLRYRDETYEDFIENTMKTRHPIVIVGANDGMVHAFKVGKIKDLNPVVTDAGGVTGGYAISRFSNNVTDASETAPPSDLGQELWAYIPYNTVPFLKWYCDKGYCHVPMVDSRFTIVDASIAAGTNPTDTRTASSWRRLMIGAMGVGGKEITIGNVGSTKTLSSSIFVLDITDPTSPTLLWEKPLPDRTLTTTTPAVVRFDDLTDTGQDKNGAWYLVIGSGPKGVTTNKVDYKTSEAPDIYVFNLKTGALVATIPVPGTSGVAVGDMMAVDMDGDYKPDVVYFGTYGGTEASPAGHLYRLRMRNGASYYTDPASTPWPITKAVDVGHPIYASPEIAVDSSKNIWIYFGTGLYLSLEHAKATTANEYAYGFKEPEGCWKDGSSCPTINSTSTDLLVTTNISLTGAKALELGCFCAGSLMSRIPCSPPGTCTGSCGANKACSNNLTKTCSADTDCPGGSCIENKVVLDVQGATLSGTGVPSGCSGKVDKEAMACLEQAVNAKKGWMRAITGQKMFARPFVAGGLVDFTSFEPTSTSCSLGGNTYLISLYYTTGTPYINPTTALVDATSGGLSSLTLNASVKLGTGVPPLGESLVALPLSGDAFKIITQVSGGLPSMYTQSALPAKGGYILWRTK